MERSILVVEGNPSIRSLLFIALNAHGYQVQSAASGASALERITEEGLRPAIVVVDAGLPDGDGLSLVRSMRKMPELRETLFLLTSTHVCEELKQTAATAGYRACVAKPFNMGALMLLIAMCISEHSRGGVAPAQPPSPSRDLIRRGFVASFWSRRAG